MCESQRYPFRVGDQWRRQIIGGKYAEVVKKAKVTVIFEIKLNTKTPETPLFSVNPRTCTDDPSTGHGG
jgi:hypothetical protein